MKLMRIKLLLVAAGLVAALPIQVSASSMDPQIESALVNICKSAMRNNTFRLRDSIEDRNLRYKTVADKLRCNGKDILEFSISHNAFKSVAFIQRKLHHHISIQDISKNNVGDTWSVSVTAD